MRTRAQQYLSFYLHINWGTILSVKGKTVEGTENKRREKKASWGRILVFSVEGKKGRRKRGNGERKGGGRKQSKVDIEEGHSSLVVY